MIRILPEHVAPEPGPNASAASRGNCHDSS